MRRHGFARADLASAIVMLAIAAALILCAGRQMRQEALTASSLSQLRWIAGATASYAADNGDQFWSFSWKAGTLPHSDPTLPSAVSTDLRAGAVQAIYILRRRSGRSDLPVPFSWIPHVHFNHLPLVDYLARDLPDFNLVAPADEYRLAWARDPASFDEGVFLPFQPAPSDSAKRWPYSSSYEVPAAMWDLSPVGARVEQASGHRYYAVPGGAQLGGVELSDVASPSQKVVLFDAEQRIGRRLFALSAPAQVALLCADGAAGVRSARNANEGWGPNRPTGGPTEMAYTPEAWEAPTATGEPEERVLGRYRWTRGGPAGRDFGGPEIDTGQP